MGEKKTRMEGKGLIEDGRWDGWDGWDGWDEWDGMGWDGMEWDGMGWDGMDGKRVMRVEYTGGDRR